MSIVIDQLDFAYGRRPVLGGVSGAATPGRITALIGPNAAGKSTLLRCAIGALRPDAGSARVDGQRASDLRGRELARRLAYVPQRTDLAAAFRVREVVELGRYALDPAPERVESALAALDLVDVRERPMPALSVGQQQRVALARAVAQLEPGGCLVLDEPTAAMDLRHARRCFSLLRELAAEGATVLVALHDLSMAAALADDIWLLAPGAGADGASSLVGGAAAEVMELGRLREVFGVGFEWIERPDGRRVLLAEPNLKGPA
jgi:iron complex transport system ATP-binding protein